MRNLKLLYCKQISTAVPEEAKFLLLNGNNNYYVVTDSKVFACQQQCGTPMQLITELPGIVGAEYLVLDNEICLATSGGEVMMLNPQTAALNESTFCDVGLQKMSWSPEQEVVVFVTATDNLEVMTCTFDAIAEHELSQHCSEEGQFVNVGWGKKETQFHGSVGKQAAKEKAVLETNENLGELKQDAIISWRADGSFFAVSLVSQQRGRMFKVFDREGQLQFVSERQNDLQAALAWRPSGNWIAVPQILANKSTVALFEKNGLRHREVVLPFDLKTEAVLSCKWSSDSDVLTLETLNSETHNLYLYTIGNYHWYLKQILRFPLADAISIYQWDNEMGEEKTLHVLQQSGKHSIYKWHFAIDQLEKTGIVAVIDGSKLLLTNFAKAIVPPPMCSKTISCTNESAAYSINACCFTEDCSADRHLLCAYDDQHVLHVYEAKTGDNNPLDFEPIGTFRAANEELKEYELGNLLWHDDGLIASVTTAWHTSTLMLLLLDWETGVYDMESATTITGVVNAICNDVQMSQLLVQTLDGKVYTLSVSADKSIKLQKLHSQLPHAADQLSWHASKDLDYFALVALKNNQTLYVNAEKIAENVTSFSLTGKYLAFTQLQTLCFWKLSALESERRIVSERKIERGAKIVTIIQNDSRVVLQLPRGNLEAINPRVLSLDLVGDLLQRKKYFEAMDMLRKQRINLNILCDHNMNDFVDNIELFLQQITNSNWLNLFLSDLLNEDLTLSMYASNYAQNQTRSYPEGFKLNEKISYLCEKMCEHMEQNADKNRYRLPIITAHVKTGKLEKALNLIWLEKRAGHSEQAEAALKYLLYLVDVNELYNVALGTYDLGLVIFVAQKSQKDPKEFLPFLNELKALETNYRQFKIDEYLKRYDKALKNLSVCGTEKFDEALVFVRTHALYREALDYYGEQVECYAQICLAFADYLRANGKLENASIMYERAGNLQQALSSAKHVLDWQRVIALALKNNKTQQNIAELACSMVTSLQDHGRYAEAYELLKNYGNDFAEALQVLLMGKQYLVAIFEARLKQQQDLIDSLIAPDLMAYITLLEANLQSDNELFVSHKQRLLNIREKRAAIASGALQQHDYEQQQMEVDECDLLSDTTSMHSSRYTGSSKGTGKTFRSSKNRRKHERKLLSLKPGNPFEDIALIDALHNHTIKIAAQQQHIRDTCKALLELGKDAVARALQQKYKSMLLLLQDSLDAIWIPELMTSQQFLTGPTIDYTQLRNEQRYAMIDPLKRFKPQLVIIDWEHDILL